MQIETGICDQVRIGGSRNQARQEGACKEEEDGNNDRPNEGEETSLFNAFLNASELFGTKVLRGKGRHTRGNRGHWQEGKGHDPTS